MNKKFLTALCLAILAMGVHADPTQLLESRIRTTLANYDLNGARSLLDEPWPAGLPGQRLRGILHHGLYNADSTLHYLRPVQLAFPTDTAVVLRLAEALLWKKDFRNSGVLLDAFPYQQSTGYMRVRATQFEIARRLEDAVKLWDRIIAMEKQPWGAMERKALVLSWLKRLQESQDLYRRIAESNEVSPGLRQRAQVRWAELLSWQADQVGAIFQLDRVLTQDPQNAEAMLLKGQALEWSKRYPEAKQQYTLLLRAHPDHSEAKLRLERLMWVK